MAIIRETTQTILHKTDLVILHRRRRSRVRRPREGTTTISHSVEMSLPASKSLYRDNRPTRNATQEVPRQIHDSPQSHNTSNTHPRESDFLLHLGLKTASTPSVHQARQIRIATRSRERHFLAPTPTDKAMAGTYRPSR
jgi:hypothetical protein